MVDDGVFDLLRVLGCTVKGQRSLASRTLGAYTRRYGIYDV